MRSRHCAAECRLDRWSSCIRSMSDLGQSAVLTVRRPLPAFPNKQTFSGSVGMSQWCHEQTSADAEHGPVASHSSVVGKTRQGCARRHRHELRDNCVTIRMPASCLGGKGDRHKNLKSFKRHKRRL